MTRKFLTPIVLPADPAAAMEAATKQYVDARAASGSVPSVWTYKYNSTTTAPPAAGEVRFNAARDRMWLSYTDVNGKAFKPRGMMAQRSDTFYLYDPLDATAWQCYQLAFVPEDTSTYMEMMSIVNVDGGGSFFTNGRNLVFEHLSANDEVAVGVATGANTDLWYDTSAQGYDLSTAVVPGNAMGIVAMGTVPGTTTIATSAPQTVITSQIAVTLQTGRRYRIVGYFRAAGAANKNFAMAVALYDNGVNTSLMDSWSSGAANYDNVVVEAILNGDGAAHLYDLRANGNSVDTTSTVTVFGGTAGYFYVEDVGPNSSPPLPVTAYGSWTTATLINNWTHSGGGVQYRKVGDLVYLRGNAGGGAATAGSVMFNLPAGFRPPNGVDVPVVVGNNQPTSWLTIATNGNVNLSAVSADKNWVSLYVPPFSVTP